MYCSVIIICIRVRNRQPIFFQTRADTRNLDVNNTIRDRNHKYEYNIVLPIVARHKLDEFCTGFRKFFCVFFLFFFFNIRFYAACYG